MDEEACYPIQKQHKLIADVSGFARCQSSGNSVFYSMVAAIMRMMAAPLIAVMLNIARLWQLTQLPHRVDATVHKSLETSLLLYQIKIFGILGLQQFLCKIARFSSIHG